LAGHKDHAKFLTYQKRGLRLLRGFSPNERTPIFDSRILARGESPLKRIKMPFKACCKMIKKE